MEGTPREYACAAVMCECERVLYSLNTTVFACIHFGLCIWSEYTYSYLRSVYSPSRNTNQRIPRSPNAPSETKVETPYTQLSPQAFLNSVTDYWHRYLSTPTISSVTETEILHLMQQHTAILDLRPM